MRLPVLTTALAAMHKHLPRYLAEFCYRFNRRFYLRFILPRLGYVAVRTPPMPYRLLTLAEAHGESGNLFQGYVLSELIIIL
jgi:hypothetical protein